HAHRTGVHPGVGVLLAGDRLALGDLVLVVGKHQIRASAVDIEGLAQAASGHHRAFDVPARPPGAPGRLPAGLARLGGFPQDEIQRACLGLVDLDACTDLQVFDPAPRKLAVADELADAVVDVAITRRIGVTLVDQSLDHREHAVYMLGSARLDVRAQYVEARLVLVHGGDHALH